MRHVHFSINEEKYQEYWNILSHGLVCVEPCIVPYSADKGISSCTREIRTCKIVRFADRKLPTIMHIVTLLSLTFKGLVAVLCWFPLSLK